MITLCVDTEQKDHLTRLIDLVRIKDLNGTEAWAAFSTPQRTKTFARKKVHWRTINFTAEEVKTYAILREKVQKKLFEQAVGSCAYCRRPVGHYGWAWHIEHVIPKSKSPSLTFDLNNLTVGCVHCNQWKGATVDKKVTGGQLPIINPVARGFVYTQHLTYVQISTESVCFAKYSTHSPTGTETYRLLSFAELERSFAINGMHAPTAALHDRLTRAMGAALKATDAGELVKLLGSLKSSIYRLP